MRARCLGKPGRVIKIDKSDNTAKLTVKGVGDVWFPMTVLKPMGKKMVTPTYSTLPKWFQVYEYGRQRMLWGKNEFRSRCHKIAAGAGQDAQRKNRGSGFS